MWCGPGNRLEVGAEGEAGEQVTENCLVAGLGGQAEGRDGVSRAKTVHENRFSCVS